MKLRFATFALALGGATLLGALPVEAKPAPRRVAATPAKADPAALKAACDDLVLAMTPDDQAEEQVDRLISAMTKRIGEDPNMAKLEARYPGILDAVGTRIRPILLRSSQQTMPLYRADLSRLYQDNLTVYEARTTATFFRSPAAQTFIHAVQGNISYETSSDRLFEQKGVSTADIRSDLGSAASKSTGQLTPAQKQQVNAFFGSPVGQKLIRLAPQKNALDAKWFNYSPPGTEKEVEVATMEAMVDHIAKTDPSTAARLRQQLEDSGKLPKKPA